MTTAVDLPTPCSPRRRVPRRAVVVRSRAGERGAEPVALSSGAHRPVVWLVAGTCALGVAAVLLIHTVTLVALFVVPATLAALTLDPGGTAAVAAWSSAWALYLSLRVHAFSGPGHGSGFASTVVVGVISTVAAAHRLRREATLKKISLVAEA